MDPLLATVRKLQNWLQNNDLETLLGMRVWQIRLIIIQQLVPTKG